MTRPTDMFVVQRYDDAPAAMDWLERAFGFERQLVVPGPEETIAFALMRLGDDVLGTGTARPDVRNAICFYVEDPDAHCQRARAAGAQIAEEVEDTDFGARIYTCRDPEGHIWSFGTFLPDKPPGCDIFPVVGYRDPVAGMAFMKEAFGMEERLILRDGSGDIVHAEIGFGYGVVMPTHSAAGGDNPWANIDFGLAAHVADPDAHYARATAAGAEIVRDLRTETYGRGYSARDLEGNLWDFSDYRPEGSRP